MTGTTAPAGVLEVRRSPGALELAVVGRVTGDVAEQTAAELWTAVHAGRPFTVLYDRRRLTAPTRAGRQALAGWGEELLPALGECCLAWADVQDERRACSLRRAGYPDAPQRSPYGYWVNRCTDVQEARAWLAAQRAERVRVRAASSA